MKFCSCNFVVCFLDALRVNCLCQGLELSSKDSEVRELNAKLHQTELNNTLQQDLLKHMMVDRVDIEVDNLMTNQVDGKRFAMSVE